MIRLATLALSVFLPLVALAGAWGDGSFENDDAADWSSECVASSGTAFVARTLQAAVSADYLEAPGGSAAVAAAEVVAAASGRPEASLPQELREWVSHQPAHELAALRPLAREALQKVLDPKGSELRQLWSEGKGKHWVQRIAALERRLGT